MPITTQRSSAFVCASPCLSQKFRNRRASAYVPVRDVVPCQCWKQCTTCFVVELPRCFFFCLLLLLLLCIIIIICITTTIVIIVIVIVIIIIITILRVCVHPEPVSQTGVVAAHWSHAFCCLLSVLELFSARPFASLSDFKAERTKKPQLILERRDAKVGFSVCAPLWLKASRGAPSLRLWTARRPAPRGGARLPGAAAGYACV